VTIEEEGADVDATWTWWHDNGNAVMSRRRRRVVKDIYNIVRRTLPPSTMTDLSFRLHQGGGAPLSRPHVVLPPVRSEVIALEASMRCDEAAFVKRHLPPEILRLLMSPRSLGSDNASTVSSTSPAISTNEVDNGVVATAASSSRRWLRRRLLVCCVRQARDKNPDRFISLIEDLVTSTFRNGLLITTPNKSAQDMNDDDTTDTLGNIIPVVFGAAPDAEYSAGLRQRLLAACPAAVWLTGFVTPAQLVAIFRVSVLNVHPSLYDAYGLTVVEAAVCQCPTLLHKVPASACSPVGVVDLLMPTPYLVKGTTPSEPHGADTIDTTTNIVPMTSVAEGPATIQQERNTIFFADLRGDTAERRQRVTAMVGALLMPTTYSACANGCGCASSSEEVLAGVASRASIIARRYDTAACGARLLEHLFHSCGPHCDESTS
jgi:hypothetical protein